jgi:hypothetical protein
MHVAETPEKELQAETLNNEAQLDKRPVALNKRSRLMPAMVVSLSAFVAIGAAAAAYAWPNFSSTLPNLDSLAELFPRTTASAPIPDPVVTGALKDIQSAQQQHATALQEHRAILQQNTAVLQQGTVTLESVKQSLAVQQTSLKGLSNQLSSLVARVDALQNAVTPLTTSSITVPRTPPKAIGASRKKAPQLPQPSGPVSVGGAPLSPVPPQRSSAG